jgi:hypothetical protein
MIEKVTVYKASDGSVHETEVSAQHRENDLEIKAYFSNMLFQADIHLEKVQLEDILKVLAEHRNAIRLVLEKFKA